jgi:hypothetical protein
MSKHGTTRAWPEGAKKNADNPMDQELEIRLNIFKRGSEGEANVNRLCAFEESDGQCAVRRISSEVWRPRTRQVSEYEPQFWGFDTQKEWDAAMEQMGKESEEKFYVSVINYVRGQPNDILPGTIGACKADIAKKLVEEDPTLLAEEHKARFLDKMNSIYDRDHAVKITLTQEDIALATMLATHEDDLPSA